MATREISNLKETQEIAWTMPDGSRVVMTAGSVDPAPGVNALTEQKRALFLGGDLILLEKNVPTEDPKVKGALWVTNDGDLKV